MYNLFVIHTPYHLLLATGIVLESLKEDRNVLVIVEDFDVNTLRIEYLNAVFKKIIILSGNMSRGKNKTMLLKNFSDTKKNINKVKEEIKLNQVKHLFIFNDSYVIEKKIMQLVNLDRKCLVSYVEDGSAAYNRGIYISRKRIYKLKWKIKKYMYRLKDYGEPVELFGASSNIDQCLLLYPELAREELKEKQLLEISENQLRKGILFIYRDYIERMNILSNSVTIFLDISTYINPFKDFYIDVITEIIEKSIELGVEVYLKYHPREVDYYLKDKILSNTNLYFIDKSVPSEAVLFNCKEKVSVISSISTCLITASKLSKDIKMISIMDILCLDDKQIRAVFKKLNVDLPCDSNRIKSILELVYSE